MTILRHRNSVILGSMLITLTILFGTHAHAEEEYPDCDECILLFAVIGSAMETLLGDYDPQSMAESTFKDALKQVACTAFPRLCSAFSAAGILDQAYGVAKTAQSAANVGEKLATGFCFFSVPPFCPEDRLTQIIPPAPQGFTAHYEASGSDYLLNFTWRDPGSDTDATGYRYYFDVFYNNDHTTKYTGTYAPYPMDQYNCVGTSICCQGGYCSFFIPIPGSDADDFYIESYIELPGFTQSGKAAAILEFTDEQDKAPDKPTQVGVEVQDTVVNFMWKCTSSNVAYFKFLMRDSTGAYGETPFILNASMFTHTLDGFYYLPIDLHTSDVTIDISFKVAAGNSFGESDYSDEAVLSHTPPTDPETIWGTVSFDGATYSFSNKGSWNTVLNSPYLWGRSYIFASIYDEYQVAVRLPSLTPATYLSTQDTWVTTKVMFFGNAPLSGWSFCSPRLLPDEAGGIVGTISVDQMADYVKISFSGQFCHSGQGDVIKRASGNFKAFKSTD